MPAAFMYLVVGRLAAMPNDPAGTNDYVYPGMIEVRENDSIEVAMNAARGEITNPIARDILPDLDFDPGDSDDAPDPVPESFLQLEGTDGGTEEVYEIDSDTGKAERRVFAIYGFEAVENAHLVNRIRFLGSDGQVFERAHIEGLDEDGENPVDRQKTLNSPILFDVQDNGTIEFVVDDEADVDDIRIKLLGKTVEKQGRRVGSRS